MQSRALTRLRQGPGLGRMPTTQDEKSAAARAPGSVFTNVTGQCSLKGGPGRRGVGGEERQETRLLAGRGCVRLQASLGRGRARTAREDSCQFQQTLRILSLQ